MQTLNTNPRYSHYSSTVSIIRKIVVNMLQIWYFSSLENYYISFCTMLSDPAVSYLTDKTNHFNNTPRKLVINRSKIIISREKLSKVKIKGCMSRLLKKDIM